MRKNSVSLALGIGCLIAHASPSAGQDPAVLRCGTGLHAGETTGTVWLPEGDLFCPLLGDPKAERSFLSLLQGEFPKLSDVEGEGTIGAVGLADRLAILRLGGPRPGDGLQLSLVAGIFAQFDLGTESFDLINADYLVGIPLSARMGGFSTRVGIIHQSSHLGDEYVLRSDIERENLSFEAVEAILSQEVGPMRVYGGGQILFNREPPELEPLVAHTGAELRLGAGRGARLVAAIDLKSSEQQEWDPAISARAGMELAHWRHEDHPPRLFALLVEFYDGPSPYGQFFQEQIRYIGIGLHLSLQ
jgi:hypothetical protein